MMAVMAAAGRRWAPSRQSFAVQTRRQELIELRLEQKERIDARRRLASSESELSAAVHMTAMETYGKL
jgi:hypothetical protein